MRKLVRQIGIVDEKNKSKAPSKWHSPWPRHVDAKMVTAFKASLKAAAEADGLPAVCAEWCDAQLGKRTERRRGRRPCQPRSPDRILRLPLVVSALQQVRALRSTRC